MNDKKDIVNVSIAILSDWASDTPESQLIAKQAGTNDYSIHLEDTFTAIFIWRDVKRCH
jgi:hypothetical protein